MKKTRLKGYTLKEQIALFASFERLDGMLSSWKNNGEYEKFDDFLLAVAEEKTEAQAFSRFQKSLFKEWAAAIRKHIKSYREKNIAMAYDVYLLEINERHKKNNIRSG